MRHPLRLLASLALLPVLACGGRVALDVRRGYPGPARPRAQVAFFDHQGAVVRSVDGVATGDDRVGGRGEILALTPGTHDLVIQAVLTSTVGQAVMTSMTSPFPGTITVQAGGTYVSHVGVTGAGAANVNVEDITAKVLVLDDPGAR